MEKYNGNKDPFLYAVYAHEDRNEAFRILEKLDEKGYKLTYEEKDQKDCIERCSALLFFLSNASLDDENILRCVSQASQLNKDIIAIYLEDLTLTPGLSMLLGQTQGIMKQHMSEEEIEDRLFTSPVLTHLEISEQQKAKGKKQSAILTGSIIALAVLAAVFILLRFGSLFNQSALLKQLGISGDLSAYKKIYVYGEEVRDDYEIAQYILTDNGANDMIVLDSEALDLGHISDVTDFAKMKNLEELCLAGNEVAAIEPISSLKDLKLLDVSHNFGIDLTGIDSLSSLETLNVAYTELEDYRVLLNMPSLKKVYISVNERAQFDELGNTSFVIEPIDVQVSTYEELKAAMNSDVHAVSLLRSIDIPEGEELVIGKGKIFQGHSLGGEYGNITINNYGTIIVEGSWEMGMVQRNNYGTIIIKDGGVYTGGMCESYNFGDFIIEKGGRQNHERGHQFIIADGLYQNDGCLAFGGGGEFRYEDGRFVNNGIILWNFGEYGPTFFLDGPDAVNNGQIYYNRVESSPDGQPYQYFDENDPHGELIDIGSVNAHN